MKYLLKLSIFLIPSFTLAFSLGGDSTFKNVIFEIVSILELALPLLFGGALIIFFWGLSKFVINSDNETELKKGKNYMLWGILALFILISYRTIVGLVVRDLEFGDGNTIPQLPTGGNVESVNSNINFNP